MQKVNLVFTSFLMMLDFRLLLKKRPIRISLRKRLLTCCCTESEIKLAMLAYEARVVECS